MKKKAFDRNDQYKADELQFNSSIPKPDTSPIFDTVSSLKNHSLTLDAFNRFLLSNLIVDSFLIPIWSRLTLLFLLLSSAFGGGDWSFIVAPHKPSASYLRRRGPLSYQRYERPSAEQVQDETERRTQNISFNKNTLKCTVKINTLTESLDLFVIRCFLSMNGSPPRAVQTERCLSPFGTLLLFYSLSVHLPVRCWWYGWAISSSEWPADEVTKGIKTLDRCTGIQFLINSIIGSSHQQLIQEESE